jgi:hypothetical protein
MVTMQKLPTRDQTMILFAKLPVGTKDSQSIKLEEW